MTETLTPEATGEFGDDRSDKALIATIHHLSASGGTLVAKVLGALSDTLVLSELNPRALRQAFTPFDPVARLFANSRHSPSDDILRQVFLDRMRFVVEQLAPNERLIVRDHSHTDFLWKTVTPPVLRQWLELEYRVRSVVTVRHPLDAWLSMIESDFAKELASMEEYCDRYRSFLDAYSGLATIRYEDLVRNPLATFNELCGHLNLPFQPEALSRFSTIKLSGDSGRGEAMVTIEPLERRHVPTELAASLPSLPTYQAICERLGYDPDPARPPLT